MIKRSLTELLEYFIFPMVFRSSHTKNVSYIRWIQMWMQFSIASWKGMFVLTAKQIETTFNEPT